MSAITLRPMTAEELAARLPALIDDYARDIHRAGRVTVEAARATAERQIAEGMPDGVDTADTLLLVAEDGGRPVGWIWLSLPSAANGRDGAWIYEVLIDAGERGKGYGRAIMRGAEEELVRRGVTRMALNVFAGNTAAIQLYESLGYRITSQQMAKRIR
ncbi:MAG: GNAT family N-acetyltransferase [Actinobacteria bacterium]|nr:MAG: GNAT family N-acetyltransferase [Actinomycetota bacterium]